MEHGSYLLIQKGMTVQGTDGSLGTVSEVIADQEADIFRGIILSHGLLLPKHGFLPADHITGVTDSMVEVNISKADVDALPTPARAGGT